MQPPVCPGAPSSPARPARPPILATVGLPDSPAATCRSHGWVTTTTEKPDSRALPELVEDRWIGFGDGLETSPACSADAVLVSVPKDTALPAKPGCGPAPTGTSPSGTMGDKIKEWLKHIVH